ncbi:G protein-regulated inducer of neurite outgrowth 3 [Conger conger]|uniref:G protein-regulated inducer of neurite outgrowth 3 n=1 Tax=Conger conger TaxID=82655 RepID=UPI002A5A1C93|nr:G protein-regulated inducer of neurite outgrowth 3 [Conger conger]
MESSSHTHLSFLPPSHPDSPGALLSKPGAAATVGGTPTLNVTAEETHEAQQGLGSRYKEAGTMTVSTEHRSTSKHSHHDAGVQAVAIVCSRSVGTSPGLTSQGGVLKLNGMATERQETLTVTCQRSSRSVPVYQITMDDSWSSQSGILSDACGQTVVSSQIHRESSLLTSKQICDHLPGPARQKGGQSNSQTTGVIHHSDPVLKPEGKGQGTTSKEAVDTTQKWLPLLQPVYQINIEPCGQSNMTSSASTCNKESLMLDSTCHHKSGTESGSSRQQGARGCFPGKADSNNVCQGSAETRSVMPPAVRPSPAQVDNLLPGALTVAESEKDQEEANPSLLNPAAEGKQVTGRLNEGLKQQAPKKQDGRACKAGQSEAGGKKKKKESERSQTNEEVRKEQSQSGSRGKAGKAKGIHDVVWDEQGMTWEVYGASADPESLGFAIQNHLQSKIKEQERLIKAQVERRRSEAPCSPAGKRTRRRQPKMFRSLMKNVRRPNCCARPPPSSVLE